MGGQANKKGGAFAANVEVARRHRFYLFKLYVCRSGAGYFME